MKISKGDTVKIMTGKDKGKIGKVLILMKKQGKVVVDGVNLYKKHQKGEVKGKGEIVLINRPIDISNIKKEIVKDEVQKVSDKAENKQEDAGKQEKKPTKKQSSKKTTAK
jgi:large subunit ribosomal protein L24